MKPFALAITMLALAGCMQSTPTVSERNSAGIRLLTAPGTPPPMALVSTQNSAARHCAGMGRRAEYMTTRQLRNGASEHYYMCLR